LIRPISLYKAEERTVSKDICERLRASKKKILGRNCGVDIYIYIKGQCRIRYNYELQTLPEDGDTIGLTRVRRLKWIGQINPIDNARNLSKISTVNQRV
jgi:hypothetical protein